MTEARLGVVVVTGGAAGIGQSLTNQLAETAEAVVCIDRAPPEEPTELSESRSNVVYRLGDVTSMDAIRSAIEECRIRFGRIDVLVNNAGSVGAPGWELEEHPRPADWETAFQVNVQGVVNCMSAVVPLMKQHAKGRIVNVSSISGRQGRPVFRHYAATKAAVIQLTHAYSRILRRDGIAVNAVCPGLVWTPMWEKVGLAFARAEPAYSGLPAHGVYERMVDARVPLRRGQTPESVASAIAYLARADCPFTGEILNVDGGIYLN